MIGGINRLELNIMRRLIVICFCQQDKFKNQPFQIISAMSIHCPEIINKLNKEINVSLADPPASVGPVAS